MKRDAMQAVGPSSAGSTIEDVVCLHEGDIEQQLSRILESDPFLHSERLRRFLDFVVRRTLQSNPASVKQSEIAVHVFDRDSSFNPDTDPIVRVEAGRLRSKLREYYGSAGAQDPVWIGLPNRGYVPIFKNNGVPEMGALPAGPDHTLAVIAAPEPQQTAEASSQRYLVDTVGVLPFADLSPGKTFGYFCDALTHQIMEALLNQAHLKVAARSASFRYKGHSQSLRDIGRDLDVSMVLEGSVQKHESNLRISVLLADAETGRHLWSNTYNRALDDIFAIQDEISARVAQDLRTTLFEH